MIHPKTEARQLVADCLTVFYARFYCPPPETWGRFESLASAGYLRREAQGKLIGFAMALKGVQLIEASHGHAQTD